ncbi:MAG TPA: alpha-amylase family glycosyl hydrolase [Spirochaetia bacterium]|nr:alpha-amylase family glycosyl hydrolase [Spirochaetia bacterium]
MAIESGQGNIGAPRGIRLSRDSIRRYRLDESIRPESGGAETVDIQSAREIATAVNSALDVARNPDSTVPVSAIYAAQILHYVYHHVINYYGGTVLNGMPLFDELLRNVKSVFQPDQISEVLELFEAQYPLPQSDKTRAEDTDAEPAQKSALLFQDLFVLWLQNENPAMRHFADLFGDTPLRNNPHYTGLMKAAVAAARKLPGFGSAKKKFTDFLLEPIRRHPGSIEEQLRFVQERWGTFIAPLRLRVLRGLDLFREESKGAFAGPGPGESHVYQFGREDEELEQFTPDRDWMPDVVLIAKSALVWLHQLSRAHGREIRTLDAIPDEELDRLAGWGFTGLWLIGIWERSVASRSIKRRMGNPEAEASAYSLRSYEIAGELGGWPALENLRSRCLARGIRLASDMVPNHTGIDSEWIENYPGRFIQLSEPPYPGYSFNGENLSERPDIGIFLEDHYYDRTDASVVFKRVDLRSGDSRYIYHGNDGTHLPWNDTAQLDFLNPETREAVLETILKVAKSFPIIRFDAAMTLAARHYQRLWFPEPGTGGDIPSRAERGLSREDFRRAMPDEFWREVVDRVARELPDTLLLAEAFWMMEGYFVRTLGMHRVYNSAFMNMLKNEENQKYRQTIKNTIEFDPDILGRFVNFMNNPDEETAIAQFGRDDKYFGVCTLMVTMPGLPMFGHGQIEGFSEKYGMEYRRAYRDEKPDRALLDRHEREIFPLLRRRYLFAHVDSFLLYDLFRDSGSVNENVFAYSNRHGEEMAIVLYNNTLDQAWGWIRQSSAFGQKDSAGNLTRVQRDLGEAFGLHREPRFFCLLFELHSQRWFIRKSVELCEKGLQIGLAGYQCQVFSPIREVEDDEAGSWARVARMAAGSGIADLEIALEEAVLEPVYAPFDLLTGPAALRSIFNLLRYGQSARPDNDPFIPEIFRHSYSNFIAAAAQFGSLDVDPEAVTEIAMRIVSTAASLLGGGLPEESSVVASISGWMLLAPLRRFPSTRSLVDEWALARRLSQRLQLSAGLNADGSREYRSYAALVRSLLAHEEWLDQLDTANNDATREAARHALEALLADGETSAFLGVNRFEDAVWFRKEPYQELTHALPIIAAIRVLDHVDGPRADLLEFIAAVSFHWREAEAASGYRVDRLLGALGG